MEGSNSILVLHRAAQSLREGEKDIDIRSIRIGGSQYSPPYSSSVSSSAAVNAPMHRRGCSSGSIAC